MLTRVHIQNFRSFVDASADLQPFTLVLGANGSGKSNFLKFFQKTATPVQTHSVGGQSLTTFKVAVDAWGKHQRHLNDPSGFELALGKAKVVCKEGQNERVHPKHFLSLSGPLPWTGKELPIYNTDPNKIAEIEKPSADPRVFHDGSGTAQVLDSLKSGDREELFDEIEARVKQYVPEIEKLSLKTEKNGKRIQVRERSGFVFPASELSEGTRLIICLLTILHQESTPGILLLEDIDRGLHPRLFEYVVPLIRKVAVDHGINIIATTHNPFLVDWFLDHKESVLIVEKQDGESRLIPLTQRLAEIHYDEENTEERLPLGSLWHSGLIGGVPVAHLK